MRKKTVARMMSAVITGSMIISLAACGSSSAPTAESAPVESAAASTEAETTEETTNTEPLEFSYYGPIWKPYQESTPIFDELMKRTNTTIDFEWVSNDALETQLASKVASGSFRASLSSIRRSARRHQRRYFSSTRHTGSDQTGRYCTDHGLFGKGYAQLCALPGRQRLSDADQL